MAVEKIDAAMIVNRLKMAKQLEEDCLKQLADDEPDKFGVYRDAQDDLWLMFCGHWKKLYYRYGDEKFDLGDSLCWTEIVKDGAVKGILPFQFIAPLEERTF